MKLTIPEFALVLLAGPSGSGKTTFAHRHFRETEVLTSDAFRAMVSDDETDQDATADAFDTLKFVAARRLQRMRLTVVDATSVRREDRADFVALARRHHALPLIIVLNFPADLCHERNGARENRTFGPHVTRRQSQALRRSLRHLKDEGFRRVYVLNDLAEIEAVEIERQPLWNNKRHETGPFDIIGDIHGCHGELVTLLRKLGYTVEGDRTAPRVTPPSGRKAIFVGDLVDRGPDSPGVLRLVMRMVEQGNALCVPGNHDYKLLRWMDGRKVRVAHGLQATIDQLAGEDEAFREAAREFLRGLVSHFILDEWRLVIAHAGLREGLQGRTSPAVRDFALYGDPTGERDEHGFPIRRDWAREYRGSAMVVYGHTPTPSLQWVNNTLCIDTGCVFGGHLTALRYPEKEIVQVPAEEVWVESPHSFSTNGADAQDPHSRPDDGLLDIDDVLGKRTIETRLHGRLTVREENTAAALEVMSRFAIDPRWLIHLPPTMAPTPTCDDGPLLEHPTQAFDAYRRDGVARLMCEEKHMGSRAIAVLCRDEDAARQRFGVTSGPPGVIHTRTGRPFFSDPSLASELVAKLIEVMTRSGLWDTLASDWVCLDGELLPWSLKAGALLREQYARTGAAGTAALDAATTAIEQAAARSPDESALLHRMQQRQACIERYLTAYRQYCWDVDGLKGVQFAPFQILAAEGAVLAERDHRWHMDTIDTLRSANEEIIRRTDRIEVDLESDESRAAAIAWWESLVVAGGEGMVAKPLESLVTSGGRTVQPGIKCRGPEYLRIIYGPEYTLPDHLDRLRERGLGRKRSLALREFALGHEGLHRFVAREPLHRVHECVFAVLALESEPVDPRL